MENPGFPRSAAFWPREKMWKVRRTLWKTVDNFCFPALFHPEGPFSCLAEGKFTACLRLIFPKDQGFRGLPAGRLWKKSTVSPKAFPQVCGKPAGLIFWEKPAADPKGFPHYPQVFHRPGKSLWARRGPKTFGKNSPKDFWEAGVGGCSKASTFGEMSPQGIEEIRPPPKASPLGKLSAKRTEEGNARYRVCWGTGYGVAHY